MTTPTINRPGRMLPPGPSKTSAAVWMYRLRRDPLKMFDQLTAAYGDVATVSAGPQRFVVARGPVAAQQILVAGQDNYVKGRQFELFREALGMGLVTNDGEPWRRSRRMVQPLFAKRHLGAYADHMAAAADAALEQWDASWQPGQRVDLDREILNAGLDTVARALVSNDLSPEDAPIIEDNMIAALDELGQLNTNPRIMLVQMILKGDDMRQAASIGAPVRFRRYAKSSARLGSMTAKLVDTRAQNGHGDRDDLLRLLMETEDQDTGERLDRQQVIDELRTFIGAGHETTAHGLTWMFYLLGQHPEALRRVEEEVETVLGGQRPDAENTEQLPWLTACFQEAMRLYPPAWVLPRQAITNDEVAGFFVPRGSNVLFSVWSTHRDPNVYDAPETFDPERWMGEAARHRPRFSYLPFGGGRRACVGQGFAMLNARILGATIIRRYRFANATTGPIALTPSITLRPKNGIQMIAHRR